MAVRIILKFITWRSYEKHKKIKQSFHLQFIIVEELSTFSLEKHSSWFLTQFLQQNFIFWRKLTTKREENNLINLKSWQNKFRRDRD